MRRTRVIPVALLLVVAIFAVLAYRTWNDGRQDGQVDRMADCFVAQADC
jgi:hypothetical protein